MEFRKEDRLLSTNKHTSSTRDRSRSGWVSEFSTDSFPHVQCSKGHWGSGSSPGRALQSAEQEGLPSWCVNRAAGSKVNRPDWEPLGSENWQLGPQRQRRESVFLSSASRSLQPGCVELYLVLYQFRGIWVSRLFSISFWMQEGKTTTTQLYF